MHFRIHFQDMCVTQQCLHLNSLIYFLKVPLVTCSFIQATMSGDHFVTLEKI